MVETPEAQTTPDTSSETIPTGIQAIDEPEVAAASQDVVAWTASEFIAHDKATGWYLSVALGAAIIAALVYIIVGDLISVVVVLFGALMFAVYGSRKPRQVAYQLDPSGITVGPRHFDYDDFRTFSVVSEGAFSSIVFMPLKRFAMPLSIYYAPEDEDKIVDILAARMPFEQKGLDYVERLMRKMRF